MEAGLIFVIGMVLTFTGFAIAMSTKRDRRDVSILTLFRHTEYGADIWWLKKWVWGLVLTLSGVALLFLSLRLGR